MDVRIAFGTELESVPNKIVDILKNIETATIKQLISMACEVIEISTDNVTIAESLLEQARLKMADCDRSITDCQMILKGYVSAVKTQNMPIQDIQDNTAEPNDAD